MAPASSTTAEPPPLKVAVAPMVTVGVPAAPVSMSVPGVPLAPSETATTPPCTLVIDKFSVTPLLVTVRVSVFDQ